MGREIQFKRKVENKWKISVKVKRKEGKDMVVKEKQVRNRK